MKAVGWIACVSVTAGLLVGWLMCAIALDNNNQGEFRDLETGAPVWDGLAPLFAIWAVVVAALTFGVLLFLWWLGRTIVRAARASTP